MKIKHFPKIGIDINGHMFNWQTSRNKIQNTLGKPHEQINLIHDFSEYGFTEKLIDRKDIYLKYGKSDAFFIFIYSENDLLKEFELHEGAEFSVNNLLLNFNTNIFEISSTITEAGYEVINLEGNNENLLVKSLYTTFSSSEHNGGEGKDLSYIYCAENIDHLCEECS